jgi:prepilin-type N-terminal cleavage/methylation domain-containing protein/prepilin-type processing-associated H-X9-DG protein
MKRFIKPTMDRAFTLIELLVVVAIISLLISILLPSLAAARENGRRVKCSTNLRSIGQASQIYLILTGYFVHPQLFPQQLSEGEFYYDTMAVKLRGEKTIGVGEQSAVWDCPNAVKKRMIWTDIRRQQWDKRYQFLSYGANDWGLGELDCIFGPQSAEACDVVGRITGMMSWIRMSLDWWGVRESQVKKTSNFICFAESNRDGLWDQVAAQCLWDWCCPTENPGAIHPTKGTWGVNVCFFDAHVAWYGAYKTAEVSGSPAVVRQQVDGIMLSDSAASTSGGQPRPHEWWRTMWSRDALPHNDFP